MRRRGGTTLIELMVYCSLLGMLLMCIYAVFITSMRYFRVAQAATELQSAAQQTVLHMVADIGDSNASTVRIGTSPPGVVFLSPRDASGGFTYDSRGNLQWHAWKCYYFDSSTKRLMRKSIAITPDTVVPVNPYTTASFTSLTGGKIVAQDMTALTLTGGGNLTITATFEKTVFSSASGATDNRVQVTDRILFRN